MNTDMVNYWFLWLFYYRMHITLHYSNSKLCDKLCEEKKKTLFPRAHCYIFSCMNIIYKYCLLLGHLYLFFLRRILVLL